MYSDTGGDGPVVVLLHPLPPSARHHDRRVLHRTRPALRHSGLQRPPFPFGALSKRRVPDDLFGSWIHPLRHNPKVRRELNK